MTSLLHLSAQVTELEVNRRQVGENFDFIPLLPDLRLRMVFQILPILQQTINKSATGKSADPLTFLLGLERVKRANVAGRNLDAN